MRPDEIRRSARLLREWGQAIRRGNQEAQDDEREVILSETREMLSLSNKLYALARSANARKALAPPSTEGGDECINLQKAE